MKTRCGTLATLTLALAASVATFRLAAGTYYWIGSSGGDWANGANWSLSEGGAAANAYPTASDDAVILSDASIAISSGNANVANLTLGGDVTITGTTEISISTDRNGKTNGLNGNMLVYSSISGAGKTLTLKTAGVRSGVNDAAIGCNICVPAGFKSAFYCDSKTILMNGSLSGGGDIIEYQANNDNGVTYSADCSGFTGTITEKIKSDPQRSNLQLASGTASFRNATINSVSYEFSKGAQYLIGTESDTYYIGAFNGPLQIWTTKATIYLGGKNENCSIRGTFSRPRKDNSSMWPATIVKEGSARVTSTCEQIGFLELQNGTFEIANTSPMYATQASPWIKFTGGTLVCTPVDGTAFDPSAYIKNSTAAIIFDDEGTSRTWATALEASNVGGLEKKGSGTLTLSAVPLYTGTTTVSEGALVIPGGTTLAKLSVADEATLYVSGTDGQTITITEFAAGTTTDNVKATTGASLSWNGNTATISRSAATYTWTDATGDHNWATPGNWTVGDEVAIVAPLAIDTVELGMESTIRIATDHTVAKIILDADVTISGTDDVSRKNNGGANGNKIIFTVLEGDKVLTLDNVVLQNTTATTVATSLAGVAGKTFCLNVSGGQLTLQGNLLGSGNLILTQTSNDYGVTFAGTGSTFDGTIIEYTPKDYDRGRTSFASGAATFPNATVTFTHQYTPGAKDNHTGTYDQCLVHDLAVGSVLTFGAFNGEIYAGQKSPTLIIGGKNEPCEFGGPVARGWKDDGASNNWNTKLVKTGTAKLTFTGTQLGDTIISNGTLAITQENPMWKIRRTINFAGGTLMTPQFDKTVTVTDEETGEILSETTIKAYFDPSSFITGSQKAIVFDSDSANYEWTSEIAASNAGGLTKKGTGTLTLTAAPAYTGLTTVEAGALVVPQGTELIVNALSAGTLTGATVTKYAYPENTTLVYDGTTRNYDSELDLSNVKTVDMSGVTLVNGTTYTIVSATSIAGYSKGAIEVEGADATKWVLRRSGNALVLAPKGGFLLIIQ